MTEEAGQRRGSEDKAEKSQAAHVHAFDVVIDNPMDPPARRVCHCGSQERIEK